MVLATTWHANAIIVKATFDEFHDEIRMTASLSNSPACISIANSLLIAFPYFPHTSDNRQLSIKFHRLSGNCFQCTMETLKVEMEMIKILNGLNNWTFSFHFALRLFRIRSEGAGTAAIDSLNFNGLFISDSRLSMEISCCFFLLLPSWKWWWWWAIRIAQKVPMNGNMMEIDNYCEWYQLNFFWKFSKT